MEQKNIWMGLLSNVLGTGGNQEMQLIPAQNLKPNVPPVDYTPVYLVGGVLALITVGSVLIYVNDGKGTK